LPALEYCCCVKEVNVTSAKAGQVMQKIKRL
jgi:hypothetical protein